jgi:patatin-like phospholipase/acyl hydrolase
VFKVNSFNSLLIPKTEHLTMAFNLLCCDGGGIRGLVTSLLIQDLNKKFSLTEKTNGFAGTSTGGLIALGLAHGIHIDDIIAIYSNGKDIFTSNPGTETDLEKYIDPHGGNDTASYLLGGGPGIFSCQYTNTGLLRIAQNHFGNTKLSDIKKFVAVNSARLWADGDGCWQSSILANTQNNPYRDTSLVDASLATSAAPTYFPPYLIDGFGYFADGGVFANNPTVSAISELLAANSVDSLHDLRVLSIGTGITPQGISPNSFVNYEPLKWGLTNWMWPIKWAGGGVPATALLNLMMDCSADVAAGQAKQLLKQNICRANFKLNDHVPLDGWNQIPSLSQWTNSYIKDQEWSNIYNWVDQNWTD